MKNDRFSQFHPAVCFAYFLAVILLSVVLLHPLYLLLSLLGAAAYLMSLEGWRGAKKVGALLPLLLALSALTPFLSPLRSPGEGHVVCMFFGRYITWELVMNGAMLSALFVAMLAWFFSYSRVMTGEKFTSLFAPLLPSLSLLLVMVLRLVPLYGRKAREISTARQSIGLGRGGTKRDMLRGGLANVGALTAWALEGAIVTADSMRARGYGATRRTQFVRYRFTAGDGLMSALLAATLALIFWAMADGGARASFVPTLYIAGSQSLPRTLGLVAWGFLGLLPTILHWGEVFTWRILRRNI